MTSMGAEFPAIPVPNPTVLRQYFVVTSEVEI